jgi:hypothetical protein
MTGLGVNPKIIKDVLKPEKPKKTRKGKGIGVLAKLAAKALAPTAIDATSNFAKDKGSGMGIKKTRKKARECYKTLNKKRQLKN